MKSHKLFVSCQSGDDKYAQIKGHAVRSLKDVRVITSQDLYSPEDIESAYAYLLVITPSYLDSPWMNFEMGVAVSRHRRSGAHVIAILRQVDYNNLPVVLRDVLREQSTRDDLVVDFPTADPTHTKRR